MLILFKMLPFTAGKDDDLEHMAQEQEEQHMMMISFKFLWSLKNSGTTFQVAIRQPDTTNLIDRPTWPSIGTPSMITRSSGLAFGEIWTIKPEESAWSGIAIGKQSIPPAST
jgi:hypothetical protein